ncbi:hypothetical protein G4L39_12045 [Limisphaera ngatamarikiensis]|uniref:Uncharacterized protein n=1 Tax=Limisphaera ngatamarikiensis TaxID=1324935 RepID=A0A6M1RJ74_9BACT|nr:hypothetical protein [Limisphaera ngatamarikiensis]NGO40118.1 hypothetical protein [Limisphaera ngatamarikiensis]
MPPTLSLLDLASCALALRTIRLSAGWLNWWGHCIVAVESFADHQQFRSTAERAGDWQGLMVGLHEHHSRVGLGSGVAVRGVLCRISPALLPADCQRLQPVWKTCPFGSGRLQRQPRPGLDRLRGRRLLR